MQLFLKLSIIFGAASFYTLRLQSDTSKTLCLNNKKGVFREINKLTDLEPSCKFFYGKQQFKSGNGLYLCRNSTNNIFKGCFTQTSPHSLVTYLGSANGYIIKQDNYKLSKGEYDEDVGGYVAVGIENPTNNIEKLIVMEHELDTNYIINKGLNTQLKENIHFSNI